MKKRKLISLISLCFINLTACLSKNSNEQADENSSPSGRARRVDPVGHPPRPGGNGPRENRLGPAPGGGTRYNPNLSGTNQQPRPAGPATGSGSVVGTDAPINPSGPRPADPRVPQPTGPTPPPRPVVNIPPN